MAPRTGFEGTLARRHGIGKTTGVAWMILRAIITHEDTCIVVTHASGNC